MGNEYRLVTESSPEHIHNIEQQLNDQILSLCGKRIDIAYQDALVLISLNLLDTKNAYEKKIDELIEENDKLKGQQEEQNVLNTELRDLNDKLQDLLNEAAKQINAMNQSLEGNSNLLADESAVTEESKIKLDNDCNETSANETSAIENTENIDNIKQTDSFELELTQSLDLDSSDKNGNVSENDTNTISDEHITENDNFSEMLDYIINNDDMDAAIDKVIQENREKINEINSLVSDAEIQNDSNVYVNVEDDYAQTLMEEQANLKNDILRDDDNTLNMDSYADNNQTNENYYEDGMQENCINNCNEYSKYNSLDKNSFDEAKELIDAQETKRADFRDFDSTNSFGSDIEIKRRMSDFSSTISQTNNETEQLRQEVERIKKKIPLIKQKNIKIKW